VANSLDKARSHVSVDASPIALCYIIVDAITDRSTPIWYILLMAVYYGLASVNTCATQYAYPLDLS
jgi:hypothetical protein